MGAPAPVRMSSKVVLPAPFGPNEAEPVAARDAEGEIADEHALAKLFETFLLRRNQGHGFARCTISAASAASSCTSPEKLTFP